MTPTLSPAVRTVFREPACADTLFLDRDGVLNHAVIRGVAVSSPRRWDEFQLAEDIAALAAPAYSERWNLVVITNQPDLSRRTLDSDLLRRFHDALAERIPLTAVYACPHVEADGCGCRKPKAGLIEEFRRDYPSLGGREIFVGDRESDLRSSAEAGVPFVLRLRPYNRSLKRLASHVVDTLWDLEEVLNHSEKSS